MVRVLNMPFMVDDWVDRPVLGHVMAWEVDVLVALDTLHVVQALAAGVDLTVEHAIADGAEAVAGGVICG